MRKETKKLSSIDHVAICVKSVSESVAWYTTKFQCDIIYSDDSWAFIQFGNIKLALVTAEQHPAHLAFEVSDADEYGNTSKHRDGSKSVYIHDPSGNAVEYIEY